MEYGHTKNDMNELLPWEKLSRKTPAILIVSFTCALVAYIVAAKLPVSYDVHLSYVVSMQKREAASDFRYDGYYALSATDLFTATLASWTAQPQTIARAYQAANIPLPTYDMIDLGKRVRAEKSAPGLVNITVLDSSRETAEAIAKGMTEVVSAFILQQNTAGTPAVMFSATAFDPWTGMSRIAPFPIALVIFVFVLLACSIGVLLI